MTHQTQIQKPAQASSKARFNSQNQPGYICKSCGGVAPIGIGYAAGSWARDESRTSCDCGYSVKPVAEPVSFNADELAELDDALVNLIRDKADYCPHEEGTAEHIERLKALRAKVAALIAL